MPIFTLRAVRIAFAAFSAAASATSGTTWAADCLDGFSLFSDVQSVFRDRDSIASGKSGSNGAIEMGIDAKSRGDLVSKGNILLRDRAKVFANVTAGGTIGLLAGASVSGSIRPDASVPGCALPRASIAPGTRDLAVRNGEAMDLAPGAYRDANVSGNGRIRFRAGMYRFKTLRTEADGRFEFNPGAGIIEILVGESLSIGDRTRFDFTGQMLPERVRFHSQQSTVLAIGTDVQFRGALVAPLAKVKAASRTAFRGSVYAQAIDFGPDVRIFHVPGFPEVLPLLNPPTVWDNGILDHDGAGKADTVRGRMLRQAFFRLAKADSGGGLPCLETAPRKARESLNAYSRLYNALPILAGRLRYRAIDTNGVFSQREFFAAGFPEDSVRFGDVVFQSDPSFVCSGEPDGLVSLRLAMDGDTLAMAPDNILPFVFRDTGWQEVGIRATFASGTVRESLARLYVKALRYPVLPSPPQDGSSAGFQARSASNAGKAGDRAMKEEPAVRAMLREPAR